MKEREHYHDIIRKEKLNNNSEKDVLQRKNKMELESLRMKYEKLLNYYAKQKRRNVYIYYLLFIILNRKYTGV